MRGTKIESYVVLDSNVELMRHRHASALAPALLAAGLQTAAAEPPTLTLDLEAGAAWQRRNDARIENEPPNTRFSLADLTGSGPYPAGRAALTWQFAEKHALRVLIAPLGLEETGRFEEPVVFRGRTFDPGEPTEATYRFDSYRVTWLYTLRDTEAWTWRAGAALKIRDAEIALRQDGETTRKTNTGVVPLLALQGAWRFAPRWSALLDFEGAAAPQGRAIDLALELSRAIDEHWSVAGGYRLLDGGADNDELLTFARFDYAVLSVQYRW